MPIPLLPLPLPGPKFEGNLPDKAGRATPGRDAEDGDENGAMFLQLQCRAGARVEDLQNTVGCCCGKRVVDRAKRMKVNTALNLARVRVRSRG